MTEAASDDLNGSSENVKDTRNYSLGATVNGKREISVVTDGLNSMMKEINTEIEKNKH